MLLRKRIDREDKTIRIMIKLYCRQNHGGQTICSDCAELMEYAFQRLQRCPFGEGKTTCVSCPVHCYSPKMKEKVRTVMRYSGPRMIVRHPILTMMHLWDGRRKSPITKKMA